MKLNYDLKSVEKLTGSMSVLGQVLTALGILAIILGAFGLVVGLVTEIRDLDMGESPVYGMAGVITGARMLFVGLALSAGGATLHAVRSIAINCHQLRTDCREAFRGLMAAWMTGMVRISA